MIAKAITRLFSRRDPPAYLSGAPAQPAPAPREPDEWLTVSAYSRLIGVPANTVYYWRKRYGEPSGEQKQVLTRRRKARAYRLSTWDAWAKETGVRLPQRDGGAG